MFKSFLLKHELQPLPFETNRAFKGGVEDTAVSYEEFKHQSSDSQDAELKDQIVYLHSAAVSDILNTSLSELYG